MTDPPADCKYHGKILRSVGDQYVIVIDLPKGQEAGVYVRVPERDGAL